MKQLNLAPRTLNVARSDILGISIVRNTGVARTASGSIAGYLELTQEGLGFLIDESRPVSVFSIKQCSDMNTDSPYGGADRDSGVHWDNMTQPILCVKASRLAVCIRAYMETTACMPDCQSPIRSKSSSILYKRTSPTLRLSS